MQASNAETNGSRGLRQAGAGPSVFQVAKAGNKVEGGFFPEPPQPRQPQAAALPPPAAAAARQPRGAVDWAPPLDLERVDQYPEATGGGCSRCDSLSFNAEWLRAFAVTLCSQCKRQESLISKSTAKQRYSLTDADLAPLGSLRKANPHKKDWQPMHLYLESQVARAAHRKHGGAEGLIEHQQARLDARLEGRMKRREQEKRREQQKEQQLRRIRQRIEGDGAGVPSAGPPLSDSEVEDI